jgi:hypothetical protein
LASAVTLFGNIDRDEGLVANKRAFWVLSKQPKEISGFGRMRVPAQFKTVQEATRYCRELNLKKGAYHPGYFIEERIGNQPVSAPSKKMEDSGEETDR